MPVIKLPYGKKEIRFNLQHPASFITPNFPPACDGKKAVSQALDNPAGTPALRDIVTPGEKVLVVVSDITRPVPYNIVLPPLLTRLQDAGIKRDDITVLFANGTHRAMTDDDARAVLGEEQARTLRWLNHDARDSASLVNLGRTTNGTTVWINRLAVEADKIVLTGAVVHHYFAGYGGGRKCLVPGIAGLETALANHRLVLHRENPGLHPGCTPGNLSGNPVHEDIMEACELLPPAFLLNVVLDPQNRILFATAGDWQVSHAEACRLADEVYGVSLASQAELVIASCGGFPKDINMIQAHKTLDYTCRAVAPGKVLILLAECAQGIGSQDYLSWFQYSDPQELAQALRFHYDIHGHTALSTMLKARSVFVILVSSLAPDTVRSMGLLPAPDISRALTTAYQLLGKNNPHTYIFPYGSLTAPRGQA